MRRGMKQEIYYSLFNLKIDSVVLLLQASEPSKILIHRSWSYVTLDTRKENRSS